MIPSRHYLVYDARTYAEKGFLELSGKVRKMAQKPRYWHVKATAHTHAEPGNRRDGQAPFQVPDASEMQAVRVVGAGQ